MERKYYLDNIRWITVILVVIYHVIYIFNSAGVISNFAVQGIPQADAFLYFVYPWFMALLFVVSGISARYSLRKRSGKQFLLDRAKRLLIPSVAGVFLLGWIAGWITSQYTDLFMGNGDGVPGAAKYLIYCFCGIGPMWFAKELFFVSAVLVLIRRLDRKSWLENLGKKAGWPAFLALFLPFWGSAFILNTPVVEVYRNGFYLFSFLLGYYVFYWDTVMERLEEQRWPLLLTAVLCGIVYTVYYFGENYASMEVLKSPFTNVYAYLMILAILACGPGILNFHTKFSRYMTRANFAYYALHYPLLSLIAYGALCFLNLPMAGYYVWNLAAVFALLPAVYEAVRRIPVFNFLLLGGR